MKLANTGADRASEPHDKVSVCASVFARNFRIDSVILAKVLKLSESEVSEVVMVSRLRATSQAETTADDVGSRPNPITQSSARFTIARITPETAQSLLALRRPVANRNAAAVAIYAQAMRAGEWALNGMPVILSRNNVLLDGVQRLYACLEAGRPFVTVLAEHVSDDTVHTIDQQRRRSFSGVLETRGVPHSGAVAGMLAKLIRYDDGTLARGTSTPPWSRMERSLEANRAAVDAAVAYSFASPARLLSETVRTPLAFMGLQTNPAALARLYDAIAHPERYEADEPGVAIQRRLVEGRADRSLRLNAAALFAVCIKALNDTVAGSPARAYIWADAARNPKGEAFPQLVGYRGLADPVTDGKRQSAAAALSARGEASLLDPTATPISVETVTPQLAERYLAANSGNRNIVRSHVSAMARDIANGQWMFNAQPICFSASGRLLNGQHRLSAVIEAGEPIEVMVMRNLPEEAFETYDKQAKKAPAADEMFEDFGDKALISATAVLLWRRERRPALQPNARPTATEIRDVIQSTPDLMRLRGFSRKMVRYGRSSAMLYVAQAVERQDARLGPIFLDRLENGANLPTGHMILKLRDRLLDLRKADAEVQIDEVLAIWEKFRKRPGIAVE